MQDRADRGLLGADLSARLEAWSAGARVDEAARSRSRERWLRQAAEEEATFAGVLLDLAERGTPTLVTTRGGRRHRGLVRTVGADFCALALDPGGAALLRVHAVATVRPAEGSGANTTLGDRHLRPRLRLADVIAGLAAEREAVLLQMSHDESVRGELRWIGHDVVGIQTGARAATAFVRVDAISEILLV